MGWESGGYDNSIQALQGAATPPWLGQMNSRPAFSSLLQAYYDALSRAKPDASATGTAPSYAPGYVPGSALPPPGSGALSQSVSGSPEDLLNRHLTGVLASTPKDLVNTNAYFRMTPPAANWADLHRRAIIQKILTDEWDGQ